MVNAEKSRTPSSQFRNYPMSSNGGVYRHQPPLRIPMVTPEGGWSPTPLYNTVPLQGFSPRLQEPTSPVILTTMNSVTIPTLHVEPFTTSAHLPESSQTATVNI